MLLLTLAGTLPADRTFDGLDMSPVLFGHAAGATFTIGQLSRSGNFHDRALLPHPHSAPPPPALVRLWLFATQQPAFSLPPLIVVSPPLVLHCFWG